MSDSSWLLSPSGQRANGAYVDDTLRARASESSLRERYDLAADFPRQRVEVLRSNTPDTTVNNLYYRRGWTDGLPIIAPLLPRVDAMVRAAKRGRNDVMAELDPLMGQATVEKVAANAVMAGCTPALMPALIAAVEAIAEPAFNLRGVQTTDENVAPVLLISGPEAERLDINGGFGALGPGARGGATLGRALPEGTRVAHVASGAGQVRLADPILDGMLSVETSDAPALAERVCDDAVRGPLLEVLHGHPGSVLTAETVTLYAPGRLRGTLQQTVDVVVELAHALCR